MQTCLPDRRIVCFDPQMDSAENLRTSTVASGKRLAIIRSNLNTKFSLHLQGGSRRVERRGNRVIGENVSRDENR